MPAAVAMLFTFNNAQALYRRHIRHRRSASHIILFSAARPKVSLLMIFPLPLPDAARPAIAVTTPTSACLQTAPLKMRTEYNIDRLSLGIDLFMRGIV